MRPARLYAAGAQCIATSLCFFLTAVVKLPVILYFPLSRRWSLTPNLSELSMDFYGRSLLALVGGAVAAIATLAVFWVHTKLRGATAPGDDDDAAAATVTAAAATAAAAATINQRREVRLTLLAGYVVTALLLAMGVYAYELYGRVPVPEPLPAGLSLRPLASPAVTPVSPISPGSQPAEPPAAPASSD